MKQWAVIDFQYFVKSQLPFACNSEDSRFLKLLYIVETNLKTVSVYIDIIRGV